MTSVVGIPGDPNIYFAGAASGGIFKSTDGGSQWRPVFDDQPVQAIGSLAIAPSDPNVVWAGTGETFIRSNVVVGNGVYKSTDGGESWVHMGLPESGRVGRILIHPADSNIVYVAALGHLYGPQEERGVYRTMDGGTTWERVLFVDVNTGAIDMAMDPANPRVIYAAMWQMQIWTWGRQSGGTGSGIYKSTDGGSEWRELTGGGRGLPRGPLGKIGLAVSPDNPARVYALIETSSFPEFADVDDIGVLWSSDNRGESWNLISRNHALTQRPLYYTRAVVAPDDHNEIHFMAVMHTKSIDGGATVSRVGSGGDNHDMWIDPLNPDRMAVAHDGGIVISTNRGRDWRAPTLPIAQMYHVWTDNQVPYFLYGNRQDGPSFRGPSNSLTRGRISTTAWHSVGGCESGWAIPDPSDSNIVWSGCFDSILERYDHRTGHAQNVSVWPDNPEGWAAGDVRYRFQWTFPVAISPHDNSIVYAGSQHVHRTTDAGRSWDVISPDLTTNDPELQRKTGGLTPDDSSPTYAAVLFAIAESPIEQGVIWAGSNDGLVHVSRDAGASWTNVSDNMDGLPPLGTVSGIEPSRHNSGKAYVAIDMHQVNSTEPQIWVTDNYGASWRRAVDGIPAGPLSYTHVVREDPVRPGLLYAGTGNALYVSFDDGARWQSLQLNLPHAPVHWIQIQEHFNDLVVATYGRGFWILDDITALQQAGDGFDGATPHLFSPRAAYRFLFKQGHTTPRNDSGAGENPTYGASFHYWIPDSAVGRPVSGEVINSGGESVANLRGLRAQAGLNRGNWNLRMTSSRSPRLRTQPLEHPHGEFNDDGWRPLMEGGRVAPLAMPGEYTLRLQVGDATIEQPLVVRQDPSSAGTLAELAQQTEFLLDLREDVNAVVDLIDEIEWLRRGIADVRLRSRQQGVELPDTLDDRVEQLDQGLIEVEMGLYDLRMTGGMAFQDTLRWPRQLFAKLTSLAGYVQGTDFAPTAQQYEVHGVYQERLANAQARLAELREEASAVDGDLGESGFGPIRAQK
ncbi:MAG: sialidase [Acidobacteria bacterium]|nr:sialidase [Acidobacteriota bacterium]